MTFHMTWGGLHPGGSLHGRGGGEGWADTPTLKMHGILRDKVNKAGDTYPTGMHSFFCENIHLWQMDFVTIEHFRILSSRCKFLTLESDFTWHVFNCSISRYI